MYFLPFASWVVPRDLRNPPASSSKEDTESSLPQPGSKGQRHYCHGTAVARAVLAPGQSSKDGPKKDKKDKKPTTKAMSGKKIGSWIVAHDDNGIPYWTNDASDESTYRLLVQQTNHPAMPLRHVGDGRLPPWKLPLTTPPKKATKGDGKGKGKVKGKGKGGDSSSSKRKTNKDKEGGDGGDGGGGGGDEDGITRMGIWEELFDAVNGTKIWYNTVTQKKTSKDPFF